MKKIIILISLFVVTLIITFVYLLNNKTYTCSKNITNDFTKIDSKFEIKSFGNTIKSIKQIDLYNFKERKVYEDYKKFVNFDKFVPEKITKHNEQDSITFEWNIDINKTSKKVDQYKKMISNQGYKCN